ncbi:SDR family NAD(P)-dependent oxidoreductase [Roseomonas haemaphysalidis]|uniref:SDR family NAD(P)-dependent oxidoreductase n=1 Tax=Roseomonas haemaphysalidis TaxID=2768162 RepID=UPI001F3CF290|nr:SDR family NAD(P)-dependent oxidoreductase [Roseomonas haemaphysalidis]
MPGDGLSSFPPGGRAVVVGASGGIGRALLDALHRSGAFAEVVGLSRRDGQIDLEDEASIAAATARLRDGPPLRLLIVATGFLHDAAQQPEKTWRTLDAGAMARAYSLNAIGPALVAKHCLDLLPATGKSAFAALSARVGSIGDNRAGGWHAYRASKAALNMLLRNLAIELARRKPEALCVGLHPGTVDTSLSAPFQGGVAPGKLFSPAQSAGYLLGVLDGLTARDSGNVFAWDGKAVPP